MALLEARNLHRSFVSRSMLGLVRSSVPAVRNVSFQLQPGQTLGIVGESGSGKSTLGRLLVGLLRSDSGSVHFGDLQWGQTRPPKRVRRDIQIVFQDPYSSLDPTKTIGYTIQEPLVVNGIGSNAAQLTRVQELMSRVGLGEHFLSRYPYELSGGQRQRVAVARALITKPKVLVCDEPVSALDVSTQAQVVNLLRDLQHDLGIAMVFISHDLSIVRNLADHIAVMYLGEIVETGPSASLLGDPRHPYTAALLAAIPGRGNIRRAARQKQAATYAAIAVGATTTASPGQPAVTEAIQLPSGSVAARSTPDTKVMPLNHQ